MLSPNNPAVELKIPLNYLHGLDSKSLNIFKLILKDKIDILFERKVSAFIRYGAYDVSKIIGIDVEPISNKLILIAEVSSHHLRSN